MTDNPVDLAVEFNDLRKNIHHKIQNSESKDELTHLRDDITQLKDWLVLKNELKAIPTFDLKNYSEQIDKLVFEFDDCKKKFIQRRFKFKNKPAQQDTVMTEDCDDADPATTITRGTDIADYLKPTYENLSKVKLTIPESCSGANIYLKNINDSIIIIPGELKVNSITLEAAQNTLFLIHSQTFIFINDLQKCIINGTSQQLRIHDCLNSLIGIRIMNQLNRFIIENCNGLKILKFKNNNSYLKIDDFNFPNQFEKNPHYEFLDESWLTCSNTKADELFEFVKSASDGDLISVVDLSGFF